MLSVTDGLFRETVRAVPNLQESAGRFDDVEVMEQLVDSAVYRCVIGLLRVRCISAFGILQIVSRTAVCTIQLGECSMSDN